jgi:hypothetical protein
MDFAKGCLYSLRYLIPIWIGIGLLVLAAVALVR